LKIGICHADFGDAFPAFGVVGGVEDFVVVFHAAAELEIGNGFAFWRGASSAEARAALISAMRLAGDCVAMDFDGLIFIEVGPVMFRDRRRRWRGEDRDGREAR